MAVYKADKPLKNGNIWIFYIRYTDLTGKRKAYKSKKFATKKEAREAEFNFIQSMDYKNINKNMTFKDLYVQYCNYQEDKIKITTKDTYEDRFKYLEILSNIKLNDFNIYHFEMWKKKMYTYNISNSYRNIILKLLKAILNYGTKWFNLNFINVYNKMTNFTNPNEIKKEMQYYTYEEFKQFISVEKELKFICLFSILYYCGLRKGELRGLTWNNIDFTNGCLEVRRNVISNHNKGMKYIITSPKTLKSIRTIPIPKHLLNNLNYYKKQCEKNIDFNNEFFIFGNNEPISNDIIRTRNIRNAKLANLKQIRIHDFRHSCASLLINNNASITLVANYLGHSKINETLNTYSHMFKNSLNDIVNTINKLDEN